MALERVGGVMIYDVTDPANANFVGYEPADRGRSTAPEMIKFISAADSPTGNALVVTANEVRHADRLCGVPPPDIGTIQGTGHTSRLRGQTVTTRGVVTAVDTNGSRGFYIQDADRRRQCRDLGRHLRLHRAAADRRGRPAGRGHRHGHRIHPERRRAGSLSTTEITASAAGIVTDLGVGAGDRRR